MRESICLLALVGHRIVIEYSRVSPSLDSFSVGRCVTGFNSMVLHHKSTYLFIFVNLISTFNFVSIFIFNYFSKSKNKFPFRYFRHHHGQEVSCISFMMVITSLLMMMINFLSQLGCSRN